MRFQKLLIVLFFIAFILLAGCSGGQTAAGGDDDDDNDDLDTMDDDDDGDDDDDDDDDNQAANIRELWGPVDMTGDGRREYIRVVTDKADVEPPWVFSFTYTIEVRDAETDNVVWSNTSEPWTGYYSNFGAFAADLDGDGVFEILESYQRGAVDLETYQFYYLDGRGLVRDGADGFGIAFDSDWIAGTLALQAGDDWNRNGKQEIRLTTRPVDQSKSGRIRYYEAASGYDLIKEMETSGLSEQHKESFSAAVIHIQGD